jgi:hypothetical protein
MALNTCKITLSVAATFTDTTNTLVSVSVPVNWSKVWSLTSGTTADKADRLHIITGVVTNSGTPYTIDLSGALTDPIGGPNVMAEVAFMIAVNKDTAAANILTVGAGSNPFATWVATSGDGVKVLPGTHADTPGVQFIGSPAAAGYGVTAGTGDILTITAAAGTNVPFDLIIVGRSA